MNKHVNSTRILTKVAPENDDELESGIFLEIVDKYDEEVCVLLRLDMCIMYIYGKIELFMHQFG